jgi:hypothetical protein
MALTEIPSELSSTPSIVDNGNATAITIDNSENVGVGVAPIGTGLNIKANGNGYTDGALSLTDADTDGRTYITHVNDIFAVSMNDGAADGILMTAAGAVTIANGLTLTDGNLVVAAGHGIDFSATSGTGTSELLDDYEVGSWTPTTTGLTGVTINTARYVKIGSLVSIDLRIVWSGSDASSASLNFGLPFPSSNATTVSTATSGTGIVFYSGTSLYSGAAFSSHIHAAAQTVGFYTTAGGGFALVQRGQVNGAYNWLVSFNYFTDS